MNIAYIVASLMVGAVVGISAYLLQHASLTGQFVSPDTITNSSNETHVTENTTKCPASCDDDNPCSLDWCNGTSNSQCSHIPINGTSDECWGNPTQCSTNTCVSGKCTEIILTNCCGNNICESSESCNSCASDCSECTPVITQANSQLPSTQSSPSQTNTPISSESNQTSSTTTTNQTTNSTSNQSSQITLAHIVISEVQADPNEFVELYNPTGSDVNVAGWYLSYFSSSRDWNNTYRNWAFPNNTVLKAGKLFLINIFNTNNSDWTVLTASGTPYSQGQISNNGSIALFPFDPRTKTPDDAKNGRIDAVGWGTPVYVFEISPIASPNSGTSLQRTSVTSDTDNNSQDFTASNPSPRNSTNQ